MIVAMPRDGAITFGDVQSKLSVLRASCSKCPPSGSVHCPTPHQAHGVKAKVIDWLDVIAADCPKQFTEQTAKKNMGRSNSCWVGR